MNRQPREDFGFQTSDEYALVADTLNPRPSHDLGEPEDYSNPKLNKKKKKKKRKKMKNPGDSANGGCCSQ
jgi:hypothetical protein